MFAHRFKVCALLLLTHTAYLPVMANAEVKKSITNSDNYLSIRLGNTTQGPIWPPSALTDENGDFIVVGNLLVEEGGQVQLVPDQAAVVSRNTTPPLDENGVENFTNQFGAPYKIVRYLDLSENSADGDMKLHTSSFGPVRGDFGGGPRIPREGESEYNLNGFTNVDGSNCPELFPSASQVYSFTRPQFAIQSAPVAGFQGDGIAYDADSGDEIIPRLKNGAECAPFGCLGEDVYHTRREEPVTLNEWLQADVHMAVKLINFDIKQKAYTAAKFFVNAKGLLPNSIYTVVSTRSSFLLPSPLPKLPHSATLTSHIITDEFGSGEASFIIDNPFPSPEVDDAGTRIIAMALGFKSDHSILGGCSLRLGAGVDIHAVATTATGGVLDFTNFVTVPASTY